MCHRLARLGHKTQGWWRTNIMSTPNVILRYFWFSRCIMILANGHMVRGASVRYLFTPNLVSFSYFIWTVLTSELHVQIPFRTSTFEVKARDPTWPFNKPIFDTLVYSLPLSRLCLIFSSIPTLHAWCVGWCTVLLNCIIILVKGLT